MLEYSERGFPMYEDKELSWSIDLYITANEQLLNYPKARMVIAAMFERRPAQLRKERYEMLKASFDRAFGHNAKKVLNLIDEVIGSLG